MKIAWGLVFVIILSGCVGNTMNPGEVAACMHATQSQVVDIPACTTNELCNKEWKNAIGTPTFTHIPIGKQSIETQHEIILAWKAMNFAQERLENAHDSCAKGNILGVITHAIPAAGDVQNALYSTEKAQWSTIAALNTTVQIASVEELTRIKDTGLYAAYAEALNILHDLATGNTTSEWGSEWGKNQEYYSNIGEQLTQLPLPAATFEWDNLFSWYDTGVGLAFPEKKKTILWFSTIWKSALNKAVKEKSQNTLLKLLQNIQADEMMQSVEKSTSPKNGLLIKAWKVIVKIEKEWTKMETDEKEKIEELISRWKEGSKTQNELEEKNLEYANTMEKLLPYFEAYSIYSTWKMDPKIDGTKLGILLEIAVVDSAEKKIPLGVRIEQVRKLEKWVNDWEDALENQIQTIENVEKECKELAKVIGASENGGDESACEKVNNTLSDALLDADETIMEIGLNTCVEDVNQILLALWGEELSAETFVAEFGIDSALPACESMKSALTLEYENDPAHEELIELWKKVEHAWKGLLWAQQTQPAFFPGDMALEKEMTKWENAEQYVTAEEAEEQIGELESVYQLLNGKMREGLQAQIIKKRWSFDTEIADPNEPTYKWKATFYIANPFGQTTIIQGSVFVNKPNDNFSSEDEQLLSEGNHFILDEMELPISGKLLGGMGKGEWMNISAGMKIIHTIGKSAEIEETLEVKSILNQEKAEWKWTPLPGTIKETLSATQGGKPLFMQWNDTTLQGIFSIDEENEEIILRYFAEGVVNTHTQLGGTAEEETTHTEWYSIDITNTLNLPFSTSIITGILVPVTGTYTLLLLGEGGEEVSFSIGGLGEIILEDVSLLPNGKRTITAYISTEKIGETPYVQETLEDALSEWMDDEDLSIAAEALKLWNAVQKNTDPTKWPSLVESFLELKAKAENSGSEIIPVPPETGLAPIQIDEEMMRQTENVLKEAASGMEKYKQSLGITCAKLGEIGYYCPIDEKTLREWKTEWTVDEKERVRMDKRETDAQTTQETRMKDKEAREIMEEKWTIRIQNVKEAQNSLESTAQSLMEEIKGIAEGDARSNVQDAWVKGKEALEKKEYGKTIFIAKGLRDYFQSENRISGMFAVPPAGYPLAGIILGGVGFFLYQRRKTKTTQPQPLKPLPTGGSETTHSREPRDSGESLPPRKRREYQ
jgi:hypothetical protein